MLTRIPSSCQHSPSHYSLTLLILSSSDTHSTPLGGVPSSRWITRNLKSQTGAEMLLLHIKTHPDLKAVMIQSAQKRCRHSLVVIVFFNMSRQIGHMSSLCKDLGDTAISSPSVIASCASRIQIEMKVSTHKVTALCGVVHDWYRHSSLGGRCFYVLKISEPQVPKSHCSGYGTSQCSIFRSMWELTV